jgi:hypothetical protein
MLTNFLEKGSRCDVLDSYGNTPLHYACKTPSQNQDSDVKLVEILLDHATKQGLSIQ